MKETRKAPLAKRSRSALRPGKLGAAAEPVLIATSRITAQGQVSVPAQIRKRLGLAPGSALDWSDEGGKLVVRKAGKYSFKDIHKYLFPDGPPKGPPVDVKKAIAAYIQKKHARR
jgi:antitoxin PrlF